MDLIIRVGFAVVGVGLILLAVAMRQLLSGRRVLDLAATKLGLTVKVDAFGLIALVGFVMIGSQLFLWYKGYEDRLTNLQQKERVLEASLAEFKEHELVFSLVFPGPEFPNIETLKLAIFVQRIGERKPSPYDLADFVRGPGGVVVSFKKLRLGDRLNIVVDDHGKRWKSFDMVAPNAQLEMKQVKTE